MKTFVLPEEGRGPMLERMMTFLTVALPGKRIEVAIKPYVRRRSLEQNAYLWGYVYPTIIKEGGEALQGWTADELHKVFLMRTFGARGVEWAGETSVAPLRSSSNLSTVEFSEFIAGIQQFCAEQGVFIEDPTDIRHE